jgi:hypothetical protein
MSAWLAAVILATAGATLQARAGLRAAGAQGIGPCCCALPPGEHCRTLCAQQLHVRLLHCALLHSSAAPSSSAWLRDPLVAASCPDLCMPQPLAWLHGRSWPRTGERALQVECEPIDSMTIHVDAFRVSAGGWLRLALSNVAGDGGITAVELAGSVSARVGCRLCCRDCGQAAGSAAAPTLSWVPVGGCGQCCSTHHELGARRWGPDLTKRTCRLAGAKQPRVAAHDKHVRQQLGTQQRGCSDAIALLLHGLCLGIMHLMHVSASCPSPPSILAQRLPPCPVLPLCSCLSCR